MLEQPVELVEPLHGARPARVLGPVHDALVVGGDPVGRHPGRLARSEPDRRVVRVPVDERDVVRRLHRDPLQRRDALRDGRARLEQVADDDRDAEAAARAAAPAERERHREPAVVDAVEQAPQLVGHADHPRVGEPRLQHDGVEQVRVVVVVADQRRLPRERGLRAAAQQRRRVVQREHPRAELVGADGGHQRRPRSARAPACGARAPRAPPRATGEPPLRPSGTSADTRATARAKRPGSLLSRTAWNVSWSGRGRRSADRCAPLISARTRSRTSASGM